MAGGDPVNRRTAVCPTRLTPEEKFHALTGCDWLADNGYPEAANSLRAYAERVPDMPLDARPTAGEDAHE